MERIKVASVQFQHIAGNKGENLKTIVSFVEQAAKSKVHLIVFPEMCITGYWHVRNLSKEEILQLAEPVPSGSSTRVLVDLAMKHKMTIGAGLIELSPEGDLYNTYVVALSDGTVHFHRKLHTFISAYMQSGNSYTLFDIPQGVKVGVLTCYDNNIVENARITALMGAEVLLAPHQTGGCNSASPKGMKHIFDMVNDIIIPTPGAVMDATMILDEIFDGVMTIDVGGATTDVHSICSPKGEYIKYHDGEPRFKRTVEGDLGVYINRKLVMD
ncbi:MAG: hypothetical protein EOM67_08860, partial [Spirochaetia bacterium]|nr:hypothetical protein [Spirochaetia bacterium]